MVRLGHPARLVGEEVQRLSLDALLARSDSASILSDVRRDLEAAVVSIIMYACVHGWVYVCMCAWVGVCMHVCMGGCMYACVHGWVYVCVCVCAWVCVGVCVCVCVRACVCSHPHVLVIRYAFLRLTAARLGKLCPTREG